MKYKSGEEPRVGDVFKHDGFDTEWTIDRFEASCSRWVCRGGAIASIDSARLLRRADGSSPAPTPTEGEQIGAVWISTNTACAHEALSEQGWHPLFWDSAPGGEVYCDRKARVRRPELLDQPFATYAGNLSAVFAGLVRLHERPVLGTDRNGRPVRMGDRVRHDLGGTVLVHRQRGGMFETTYNGEFVAGMRCDEATLVIDSAPTEPAPPPSAPPPLVDAEELAARQRERHRAEAAALQERYRAFHETVTRVVHDEAPGARVVTDFGLCDALGTPSFYAWVEHCGLKDVVRIDQTEPVAEAAKRASYVVRSFRDELGSRLLKGGGKG